MDRRNRLIRAGLIAAGFGAALGNTSVGLLLTLAGLLGGIWRRKPDFHFPDRSYTWFLVLLGWMAVSALMSPVRWVAALLTLGYALLMAGFVFGARWLGDDLAFVTGRLMPALLSGSIISYVYAVVRYSTAHLARAEAPFTGSNGLGTLIILCGGVCLGHLWTLKTQWRRPAIVLYFILAVAALLLTLSRGAWLGFLAMLVAFAWVDRPHRPWLALAVIGIAVVLAVDPAFRVRFLSAFQVSASGGRVYIWRSALNMIKDHPLFGVGAGVYMHVSKSYALPGAPYPVAAYAHNLFLQVMAEFGLPGFVVFIAILGRAMVMAWRLAYTGNPLYQGIFAALVGILVHQQVDIPIWGLEIGGAFWLMVGLVIASYSREFGGVSTKD